MEDTHKTGEGAYLFPRGARCYICSLSAWGGAERIARLALKAKTSYNKGRLL